MRPYLLITSWICLSIAGCKSTGTNSGTLETAKSPQKNHIESTEGFKVIDAARFQQLQAEEDGEFLGCLCTAEQSGWRPWRYLRIGSHGYRTALSAGSAADIESCVKARKDATSDCGGAQ